MADKSNNFHGLGRRKQAVAQVLLTDNVDERLVNGIDIAEYFPTVAEQSMAVLPLTTVSQQDAVGFKAKVNGGGKVSQAGALQLAFARALVEKDEGWRKQLKDTGSLSRDPRSRERKKPGLKRARRAGQFSKR